MEQIVEIRGDVLELIVDALISSMKPLPLEALATEDCCVTQVDGYEVERRTLLNMCLVRREWAQVVRRGLWHRAIFRASDLERLDLLANAPNLALIRELALIGSGSDEVPYWDKFTLALRQTPDVRELYIDMEAERPTEPGFLQLMHQLRHCRNLERLWLVGDMEDCYEQVIRAISCLPSLKTLVLDTILVNEEYGDIPPELEPPRNLESIALVDALTWRYASWLIRPRDDRFVLDLAFSLEYPEQLEEDPDSMEYFYDCLRHLRTICISTCSTDGESERDIHSDCLAPLLGKTQELSRFVLTVSMLRTSNLHLPSTLEVLHVHHDTQLHQYLRRESDMLKENDRNIAAVISDSRPLMTVDPVASQLRQVILSFTNDDVSITDQDVSRLQKEAFAETQLACSLTGISLNFETYASPYFGILAETRPFAF